MNSQEQKPQEASLYLLLKEVKPLSFPIDKYW